MNRQNLLHSLEYGKVSQKCKWHSVPPVAQSTNGKHFRCKQTM